MVNVLIDPNKGRQNKFGVAVMDNGTVYIHCDCIKTPREKVCRGHVNSFLKLLGEVMQEKFLRNVADEELKSIQQENSKGSNGGREVH